MYSVLEMGKSDAIIRQRFVREPYMYMYSEKTTKRARTSTCTRDRSDVITLNDSLLVQIYTIACKSRLHTCTVCLRGANVMQIYSNGSCVSRTSTCTAKRRDICTYKYMYTRQKTSAYVTRLFTGTNRHQCR